LVLRLSVTVIEAQVLGPPAQLPDWQVSGLVQLLPSLQEAPLVLAGLEQAPVDVLHMPASWH
jgi:hypothetical protein